MQAKESRLRSLIDTTMQLVIPLFQRFYVWDRQYWNTLWDDIQELAEDTDQQRSHFLGSLVLIPADNLSLNLPKFIVIDGQQRMATLMVLLAAVRDHAREHEEPKLAEEIEQKMLFNRFEEGDGCYKLLLSDNDYTAFQTILDGKASLPDHRLSECHGFFRGRIRNPEAPPLRTLFETIAQRLSLVTITLETHENPYLVFESLNFKGHKLTEADLIRNYLFMRIPQKQQKSVYLKYWKPMEGAMGESLTEFVRHYLSRSGTVVKQSEVYITLKKRLGSSDVFEAIKELAVFAEYYARLLHPDTESSKLVHNALESLNRLEITTVYPFLLNLYRDYSQNHLTDEQFAKSIGRLENYLVRRFVCGLPTNELNKIFAPLYNQIQQQLTDDFVQTFEVMLQNKGYPNDDRFRKDLIEKKLYGRGDREKKTRFLLESLERHYKHKEQVKIEDLTIEHVMPQTLNDWWKGHLGDDWTETHDTCLHTIGNLTLTGYNGELSNSPYPAKRQAFLNSHLVLNGYFKAAENWRQEDILERAEHLVEQALNRWPYFGDPGFFKQPGTDGIVGTKPETLVILDRTFTVKSWREVLQFTLSALAELDPGQFDHLSEHVPQYIAKSPQGFRNPKELGDGYYYIETNLGAAAIHRLCRRVIETMGYSPTDWVVKVTTKSD
ncbi:DUF262 domain-containing protein [uncultured Thiocystis sp.]|uniref:DUF262 domain-containing protein n=1 Tax=uncultured Thiocystis sp. TaxID=1202134 RepID=UPI0025F3C83A|nr:DUF262 domain-containing protein [uncultured Thiocystis sp.]